MLAKTYAALKADAVPEELAQNSSNELGGVEELCGGLRSDLCRIRTDIAYIRRRSDVLIWVVGINAAATISILDVLLRR